MPKVLADGVNAPDTRGRRIFTGQIDHAPGVCGGQAHEVAAGNAACDAHGRFQRPEALTRGSWSNERTDGSRKEARPYEIQNRRFALERRQDVNRHDSVPRSVQGLVAQHLGDLRGSEVDPSTDLQASLVDSPRPFARRAQADPQAIR